MTTPARLDHERVLHVATKAIAERLGYPAPWAVLSIARLPEAPGGYELHLNSGGNAIAVTSALRHARYECPDPPTLFDARQTVYGQRVRVRLPQWALDEISAKLRQTDWEPPVVFACECQPQWLCPAHAEQRAVDHYAVTG